MAEVKKGESKVAAALNGDGKQVRSVPITFAEFVTHNTKESLWILVDGKVYDVTSFKNHPGSFDKLLQNSAVDSSVEFKNVGHKAGSIRMMEKYFIGEADPETVVPYEKLPTPKQPDRWLYISIHLSVLMFFYLVSVYGG